MKRAILAASVVVLSWAGARGETVPAKAVALGWQTERAEEVFVGVVESEVERGASGAREVVVRVAESIRGRLAPGSAATITSPDLGVGKPWVVGGRCLAFLDAAASADPRTPLFRMVSGSHGVRMIEGAGPESRFPEIVRRIAGALGADGRVKDADGLRKLFVGWMEDADPGVAWSAAADFCRHEELHAALSEAERVRIVAAYCACPVGKSTKAALALAVAVTRHSSAAGALVDTLLHPDAKLVRSIVAEALRRLRDPGTEALLDEKLATDSAATRKTLLVAVGAVGAQASVPTARRSLADDDAAVRAEAARALGLIARNVRGADASARVEGRADLEHSVDTANTDDEARAALWALAQLDDQEAWSALRRFSADEKASDLVRRTAARYLKEPRVSLLLE